MNNLSKLPFDRYRVKQTGNAFHPQELKYCMFGGYYYKDMPGDRVYLCLEDAKRWIAAISEGPLEQIHKYP